MMGENIITKRLKKNNKKTAHLTGEDFYKRVEQKAYELYESKGYQQGNDWENWFQAEEIVRAESK